MKKHLWLIYFIGVPIMLSAQSNFTDYLNSVEQNNLILKSAFEQKEAIKTEGKQGIFNPEPFLGYTRLADLSGSGQGKTYYSVGLGFEYPLVYQTRKKISSHHTQIAENEFQTEKIKILEEAALTYIEYVYLLKQRKIHEDLFKNASLLKSYYQKELERGNMTRLENNKILFSYIQAEQNLSKNVLEIKQVEKKLKQLNGGVEWMVSDTTYPVWELWSWEQLQDSLEKKHTTLTYLQYQMNLNELNVKLARQQNIPTFELSYEQENEPGARFGGIRLGMAIPVFQNQYQLKTYQTLNTYYQNQYMAQKEELFTQYKQFYEEALFWKKSMETYENYFSGALTLQTINKAFENKELSYIEYLHEVEFYHQSIEALNMARKEYASSLVRLYSFLW